MTVAEVIENNQIVNPNSSGRNPDGTFTTGNQISVGNGSNAGYARPSRRLESILHTHTGKEIIEKINNNEYLNLKAIDTINFLKAHQAVSNGDDVNAAIAFVYDKLEPQAKGASVAVQVNNAISNGQPSGIQDTLELARGLVGSGEIEEDGGSLPT